MRRFLSTVAFGSLLAVAGLFGSGHASAASPDCDNNAIMRCGASSPSNFIKKVNDNAPGDLKTIYSNYGLVPGEYTKFASSAQEGTAYKDGRIVVDGQVVGHASQSIGRQQGGGNTQKVVIGGNTYWGGPNSAAFGSDSLPVMVLFNDKGVMQFAVLSNCGNPETIIPVTPSYSCDAIHKNPVSGQANTYSFTTDASAAKGATVTKAVYDFGDGKTATVTDLSKPVQHTFTKSSNITVTVFVKVPGGSSVTTTSLHCRTSVTVQQPKPPTPKPKPKQPFAVCTSLVPELTDSNTFTYKFTVNANFGGGATFKSADFNFGDGVKTPGVTPTGSQAIISHTYGQAGTHTITAILHFANPNGSARAAVNCQAKVTPTQEFCKPGVSVGSAECTPQLPNTGSSTGLIGGIFGGASALGAVGHFFIRKRLLLR